MKKRGLALFLAMAMSLTACGGGAASESSTSQVAEGSSSQTAESSTAQEEGAGEKVRIGGLGPMTGALATYGVSSMNGAKLAFSEINEAGGIAGKPVEFLLEDEKGDPTEAVNAFNKLMDEGMVALLGNITSGAANVTAQETQSSGLPMLTPTGTQFNITEGRSNVFRACYTDPFQGLILAQFAKNDLSAKTAAVLVNSGSDYSDGVAQAFVKEAGDIGLEVVANESYGDADNDMTAQLTSIAAKNPDVLLVPDYYEKDALILQQAKEVGFKGTILGADGWDGVLQLLGNDANIADGVYFTNHYSPDSTDEKVQNFVQKYRDTYGEEPTAFSALSYDAAYMLKQAIEEAGSTDAQKVVDAMKKLDFTGVTGHLQFDENNNPVKGVALTKIEGGKYTFFKTVESTK
ncbi:MAG: ABC transporter substrate-binding protein [Ndongobacter sp.]|nr:ABC transporter substrate-binding protein [Ndongobacter sp.]